MDDSSAQLRSDSRDKAMTGADIKLIETVRVEPGRRVPLRAWHQRRLRDACNTLGYAYAGARLDAALDAQLQTLAESLYYRLRLTLSESGEFWLDEPTVLPRVIPPVRLALSPHPLYAELKYLQHKTTHRPWYEETSRWLAARPAIFDVIFFNDRNEMCEGSRSNLYLCDADGRWITPAARCGLLPGVQRQALIDQGLVSEAIVSRDQFLQASSIRISNALRGWLDATLLAPADGGNQ